MFGPLNQLKLTLSKVDQRHVKVGVAVVGLILFVVGAGAPHAGGGPH